MATVGQNNKWSNASDTNKPAADIPLKEDSNTAAHQDSKDNFILPPKRETRSKRAILLIRPSVYDKLKISAAKQGRSFNDLANSLFELYLSQQANA